MHIHGGLGGQSWTKMVFFQCIGLHVLLKFMLGVKSTGWCGLDPWLTISSILTSFFLAPAYLRLNGGGGKSCMFCRYIASR